MSLPRLIPTAMPLLGPFSFLCHQKWESYLKVTPSFSERTLFWVDAEALSIGTEAPADDARTHARRCAR